MLSCEKDTRNSLSNTGFDFQVNGTNSYKADSTFMSYDGTSHHNIYAYKHQYSAQGFHYVQISLTSNQEGTYPVTFPASGPINWIYYSQGSTIYTFKQGSVTITSNRNNRITGHFSAVQGTDPAFSTVTGTFTNIEVR